MEIQVYAAIRYSSRYRLCFLQGHTILEAELILDRDGNGGHLCSLYYLALSIILCFLILFRLSLYAGFYWYTKFKVEDDVEGSGINASVGDLGDAAVNPQPALLRATVKEEVVILLPNLLVY